MIMGIHPAPHDIGSVVRIDFVHGDDGWLENVPVMILRVATSEEWVRQQQERFGVTEAEARLRLNKRLSQFPGSEFYEVSVD